MFKKFKEHMKQPLTYGWYYKNCALSAILAAVIYGVICLIGYIGSRKSYSYSWEGDEEDEEEVE